VSLPARTLCFNPRRALTGAATGVVEGTEREATCFNPRRALTGAATPRGDTMPSRSIRFNPRRALTGAATRKQVSTHADIRVSIRAAPSRARRLYLSAASRCTSPVSIRAAPSRARRHLPDYQDAMQRLFQSAPRPHGRGDFVPVVMDDYFAVSIRAAPSRARRRARR